MNVGFCYAFRLLSMAWLFYEATGLAWVLPEHRRISELAVEGLSAADRAKLQQIWKEARKPHQTRLADNAVSPLIGSQPTPRLRIDFADLPALAGDHSTSPSDLAQVTTHEDWPLDVLNIGELLRTELAQIDPAAAGVGHSNVLRRSDLRLQRADVQYATRAGSNGAHFLLALDEVGLPFETYFRQSVASSREINALGLYAYFHSRALEKAERSAAMAALYDEAFALHFLQDAFAAGHVAGNWGGAAERKGTHDYFNEKGLKTSTWNGKDIVLVGDAWMRPGDAEVAALPVRASLEQVIRRFALTNGNTAVAPDAFDVTSKNTVPSFSFPESLPWESLKNLPVPGLRQGIGSLPRFRSEVGPFLGLSPSSRFLAMEKGFAQSQHGVGGVSGLEFAARGGLGLDGVLNESSDGLMFLELGYRLDASSSQGYVNDSGTLNYGALASAVPARSGLALRVRVPFFILPGDLLFAAPLVYLFSPSQAKAMAVTAVNGGLLPWQAGIKTAIGRFQFVLGREMAVYLFGRGSLKDAFILPRADSGAANTAAVVSYMSDQFEFPFLEYRPFHHYSDSFTYNLLLQFYAGFDKPHSIRVISNATGVEPALRSTVWYGGFRLIYDYRNYF